MDDEDVEYFEHMADIRKKKLNEQHEMEELELAAFRSAKSTSHAAVPIKLIRPHDEKKIAIAPKIGTFVIHFTSSDNLNAVVKKKRKVESNDVANEDPKHTNIKSQR